MANLRSFNELAKQYNREESKVGNKMADTNNNTRRRRQEFTGTSKYYNHDRRFGFIYVSIPSGTELNYDIKTADKDDSPGTVYQAGETLDRDVISEAFIHGSVIEAAGHMRGLADGQEITVQIDKSDRGGIQAVWTKPTENAKVKVNTNEPRPCNAALAFVPAKVKRYFTDKKFGFLVVTSDPESGEPLDASDDTVSRDVYFNHSALSRAGYSSLEEGDTINVRYWTDSEGKSKVTQFQHKDNNKSA